MLGATRKKLTCLPGFNLEPCESLIGKVKFSDHEGKFGRSILERGLENMLERAIYWHAWRWRDCN